MKTKSNLLLLAALILTAPTALAATAVTTSISLSPNPVTDPNPATITGTILKRVPPAPTPDPVSGANVAIQELMLSGVGVPCGTSTLGVGWVSIFNTFTDINGQVSVSFDTTGLGGSTICFRAKPDDPSIVSGNPSPGADLVILSPPACTPGATIAATFAGFNGTPAPGTSDSWIFRITVTACGDLTKVSAQGGANGWAPFTGFDTHGTGSLTTRKDTKKNTILLWTIGDMTNGQVANLDVQVSGSIPKTAPDCQVRYLSGPWSAIFSTDGGTTFEKSDYTGRVSISVDTNGDGNESCP